MDMKIIVILVVFVQIASVAFGQTNSPIVWKGRHYVMPWLQGPNVCAVQEVQGTGKRYYADCMPVLPREICGKPTMVRYHCCTGYEDAGDGSEGCRGVTPVRSLMDKFDEVHLTHLKDPVTTSELDDIMRDSGPFTVFAPDADALASADRRTRSLLGTRNVERNQLRLHVVEGRYPSSSLRNDMMLSSLYDDADLGKIKFNRYSNGITTANCVRLSLPDQTASNGVLHLTEGILKPYPSTKSLFEVLMEDDSERFGELVTGLIMSGMADELRNVEAKHVTIFAPTDNAFRQANPELIQRLYEDGSGDLLRKIIQYHIVNHELCSPAIWGPSSYHSQEGQRINLTCDVNDRFLVNGNPTADSDIMASNGVIHVIDQMLIPDSVKTVDELLREMDFGRFQEYAQQAGLTDILSGKEPGEYTYFVPNEEAFRKLTRQQRRRIQMDSAVVRRVFSYHVVPERVLSSDLTDGQALETISGPPLRVEIYPQDIGINSALLTSVDNMAGNGVIHVVDRLLFPPEETAMETIKSNPELSTFASLLTTAGLDRQLDQPETYTVLAPNNDAFDRLPQAITDMLLRDENELRKALSYHIMPQSVFSSSINEGLRYRFDTLSGDDLYMESRSDANHITVNDHARVRYPDIESTSGVIHVIDDVLQCPCVDAFNTRG